MEFTQFFKTISSFLEQSDKSILIFTGSVYPHLFFTQLFEEFKKTVAFEIKCIDVQADVALYKVQLSTSFLGMSCLYWLGNLTVVKGKQKDDLFAFLKNYDGPHKIILFLDNLSFEQQHIMHIPLKDAYFLQDAKTFCGSLNLQQVSKVAFFLQQIYKIKNSYTLDELCFMMQYQHTVPADAKEFYQTWINRLVVPESSLFTLSQLFFEKKAEQFFTMWFSIKDMYGEIFWVSYWSEQLYKAYFFIRFTQDQNFAAAKQMSFGLPFSFMKTTYKQYQLDELQRAHDKLFFIDCALKNGGNNYLIDQWYVDFFEDQFKK
ncbi:MAG: hypothetical protein ACXWL5_02080 [Candidatus Chromulinivorax sp.]